MVRDKKVLVLDQTSTTAIRNTAERSMFESAQLYFNRIADRKKTDMRIACHHLAVNRVAEAFSVRGIFP